MAVIALASAKGSPGVTTTSLALALTWPRAVMLVEGDPAGGDIMAGYVRAELRSDRGIGYLAVAARRDNLADELPNQVIDLGHGRSPVTRLLLPGVPDPVESAGVAPAWPRLTDFFGWLGRRGPQRHPAEDPRREPLDVIVDCGRLISTYPPLVLMTAADVVLIVVRSTLRSASSAAPVVATLRREIADAGGDVGRLGLVAVEGGEYKASDLTRALGLPVLASMPMRERDAAALSEGLPRVSDTSPLMKAARQTAEGLVGRFSRAEEAIVAAARSGSAPTGGYPTVPPGYPGQSGPGAGYPSVGTGYSGGHAAGPADAAPGVARR